MLEGRVIVITHAKHFVGPATTGVLAGYGATVICHDGEAGPGVIAAESIEPEALIEEVVAAHGRIDTLICNDAYPAVRAPVDEAEPGELRKALEALVEWPYRAIGRAANPPRVPRSRRGRSRRSAPAWSGRCR